MMPCHDPLVFWALVERRGELELEPLVDQLRDPERVKKIATSKTALKNWKRSFEFHKSNPETGERKSRNGNCHS